MLVSSTLCGGSAVKRGYFGLLTLYGVTLSQLQENVLSNDCEVWKGIKKHFVHVP